MIFQLFWVSRKEEVFESIERSKLEWKSEISLIKVFEVFQLKSFSTMNNANQHPSNQLIETSKECPLIEIETSTRIPTTLETLPDSSSLLSFAFLAFLLAWHFPRNHSTGLINWCFLLSSAFGSLSLPPPRRVRGYENNIILLLCWIFIRLAPRDDDGGKNNHKHIHANDT